MQARSQVLSYSSRKSEFAVHPTFGRVLVELALHSKGASFCLAVVQPCRFDWPSSGRILAELLTNFAHRAVLLARASKVVVSWGSHPEAKPSLKGLFGL